MFNSKSFKKVMCLFLTLVMVVPFALAGCGKKGNDIAGKDGEVKDPKDLKPYELTWYTIGTPQKDTEKVMEELSKYTKEKINATVKMEIIDWSKYTEKMKVMLQSGEKADLVFTCSWALPYEQLVSQKMLLPLDDLLDKYGKGIKEELDPMFIDGNKIDGKLYAIANNKELSPETRWVFNKNLVDKYNLDVSNVKSLESLEPLLKVVKENEKDITDIYGADCGFYTMDDPVIGGNVPLVVPYDSTDYKIQDWFEIPRVHDELKTMHEYYKKGYIRKDVATFGGIDRGKTDKWFVKIEGCLPYYDEGEKAAGRTPVVSVPMFDQTYVSNFHVAGSMIGIPVTSKDPERAMMFLNLLNTDPYVRNLVNSGIEGVHYEKKDGKKHVLPAGTQNYDVPSFSLGNIFILDLGESDPDDLYDQYKKFNAAQKRSPIFGFKANLDPIKKEVSAFENIWQEFGKLITEGVVDIDEVYPKYMAKMKAAGYDKVKAELQKQLDQWVKDNKK